MNFGKCNVDAVKFCFKYKHLVTDFKFVCMFQCSFQKMFCQLLLHVCFEILVAVMSYETASTISLWCYFVFVENSIKGAADGTTFFLKVCLAQRCYFSLNLVSFQLPFLFVIVIVSQSVVCKTLLSSSSLLRNYPHTV